MTDVVICGFSRSPFTPAHKGGLSKIRPDDLAAQVVKGLIEKTGMLYGLWEDPIRHYK